MTREEALAVLKSLGPATLEAVAVVCETAVIDGDWLHDEGGSWQEEERPQSTLDRLAAEVRALEAKEP